MAGSYVQDYCRRMRVEIILKGLGAPTIPVNLISSKTKRSDWSCRNAYDRADRIIYKLDSILAGCNDYDNWLEGESREVDED